MTDRDRLKITFESAAQLYQRARPEYPSELYDELVRVAELRSGDRLLEIGCATGKATVPLARRGFRITCVEIGAGARQMQPPLTWCLPRQPGTGSIRP